jgi:ATP-dependent exoDNAse (exonuclease V) alpha subunit
MEAQEALDLLGLTQGFSRAELDGAAKELSLLAQANKQTQLMAKINKARKLLLSEMPAEPVIKAVETAREREPRLALDYLVKTKTNVFITGPGGCGKSYLLTDLIAAVKDRAVAVIAPTGTAAMNLKVKASTANSFFKMPTHDGLSFDDHTRMSPVEKSKFKALELLVIDEISMLSADFVDAIDLKLRAARRIDKPFGGVQVFMFGDPYQLSPVPASDPLMKIKLREKYPAGDWFFMSEAYEDGKFEVIELQVNHRVIDDDVQLIENLRKVREGKDLENACAYFNKRVHKRPQESSYITLVAKHDVANPINSKEMDKLPGETTSFKGTFKLVAPDSKAVPKWEDVPIDETLELKVGAQVMFIKNDDQGGHIVAGKKVPRWANGHLGEVREINATAGLVKVFHLASGNIYEVKTSNWDLVRHEPTRKILDHGAIKDALDPTVQASYIQFPLRLSWALTIHKSQGKTLSSMVFDPTGVFAAGQTYVALSRVESIGGLGLVSPINPASIIVDRQVIQFMRDCTPIHF